MIINSNKTKIIILAGGQSTRFGGGYKTLYQFNNQSLLNRILKNFESLGVEIALNVNSNEEEFKNTGLNLIKDEIKNFQGPLAGIYSSIKWIIKNKKGIEWIFTIPSDTPFLHSNILKKFFKTKFLQNTKIILAKNSNKIHPVIGMWHISILKSLEKFLKKDNRKIMKWVEDQNFELLNFKNKNYFFNINSKSDLTEAKKIERLLKKL